MSKRLRPIIEVHLFRDLFLVFAFVTLFGGTLFAQVATETGKEGEAVFTRCWVFPLETAAGAVLGGDGEHSYVGTLGGSVISVSQDGHQAWSTELGGEITSNIAVNSGLVLVVTTSAGTAPSSTLRGISSETGIARWSVPSPKSVKQWIFVSGTSAIMLADGGTVSAFSTDSGKEIWARNVGFPVTAASSLDGHILAAGSAGHISLIASATGEVSSLLKVDSDVYSVANASTDSVFVGDGKGTISLFDHGQKPVWKYRTGGAVSNIITARDHVLLASNDNFIYSITTYRGSVAWKRRLGGRAGVLAVIDGGLLLAGTTEGGNLMAIETHSGKPAGQIVLLGEAQVMGIASGGRSGRFRVLSTGALYGYSSGACS